MTEVNITGLYTPQYVQPPITYAPLISITEIIIYFLVYLIIHIIIGILKEKQEKQENKTEEDITHLNVLKFLFKWWPAMCVIMIILLKI